MSRITPRNAPGLVSPRGHYAHTVTHGGVVYVSGQLPVDPDGTVHADQPFAAQTALVLDNLDACLMAAGTTRDRLLSVTVFVADMADWPEFDVLYGAWLGEHRPSRAVAGAAQLHYDAAIEIQAIAAAGLEDRESGASGDTSPETSRP